MNTNVFSASVLVFSATANTPMAPPDWIPNGPNFTILSALDSPLEILLGLILAVAAIAGIFRIGVGLVKIATANSSDNARMQSDGKTMAIQGLGVLLIAVFGFTIGITTIWSVGEMSTSASAMSL